MSSPNMSQTTGFGPAPGRYSAKSGTGIGPAPRAVGRESPHFNHSEAPHDRDGGWYGEGYGPTLDGPTSPASRTTFAINPTGPTSEKMMVR